MEQALVRFPEGTEKLIVRNFNARLLQPCGQHKEDLATDIANHILDYQKLHFIPHKYYRGERGLS